ncbi:MAG TPA: hemolysin family protein [Caulobacteraceae bacterium]
MANADDQSTPEGGRGLLSLIRRLAGAKSRDDDQPAPPDGALELIEHAEAFQTLRVEDVMTPRVDVEAVDISTPFGELVAQFIETEHSRLPVYRDTLDDPVGVVHIKDVFKLMATAEKRPGADDLMLHKLRREVLYVPASMRAADLLLRMQTTRIHMALVIDEFGGTDGLVTLEDLVEAVVGDIADEHDEAEVSGVVERPGGVFEADARAPLEDLESAMGQDLAPPEVDEEIDTVAGLVTALAGRVPQRGEVIAHEGGFDFEIIDADPRRVKRVRVRPSAVPPTAA